MNPAIDSPNEQSITWAGRFGQAYTDRNDYSPQSLDVLYFQNYGITRRELNQEFLKNVPRTARILEVGCNIGTQLLMLQQMGFTDLYGIEIQPYALRKAKARLPGVDLCLASALAIPYPESYFDLVFTSGVLIHIAPRNLPVVLGEIHRCTKSWIWGFEYFAREMTEVSYRDHANLLWKADYARLYLERFGDLKKASKRRLPYLQNENEDCMFLLCRHVDHQEAEF